MSFKLGDYVQVALSKYDRRGFYHNSKYMRYDEDKAQYSGYKGKVVEIYKDTPRIVKVEFDIGSILSECWFYEEWLEKVESKNIIDRQGRDKISYALYFANSWTNNNVALPEIVRVIHNDPATIVIWKDGTKTIVKCNREDYDPEKGLAMAISKKALGNKGNYFDVFKEWLPDEEV